MTLDFWASYLPSPKCQDYSPVPPRLVYLMLAIEPQDFVCARQALYKPSYILSPAHLGCYVPINIHEL